MAYLHKNRICHRDIKPENFLLYKEDDDTHIKLIDFNQIGAHELVSEVIFINEKEPKGIGTWELGAECKQWLRFLRLC